MKFLFVCRGNVGRSQMAEELFRTMAPQHQVISAGTRVIREDKDSEGQRIGELETANHVLAVLKELGINAENNVRNQVTPEMIQKADKVIVMAEEETVPEFVRNEPKIIYWNIPDPLHKSIEETRSIREQLRGNIADLLRDIPA